MSEQSKRADGQSPPGDPDPDGGHDGLPAVTGEASPPAGGQASASPFVHFGRDLPAVPDAGDPSIPLLTERLNLHEVHATPPAFSLDEELRTLTAAGPPDSMSLREAILGDLMLAMPRDIEEIVRRHMAPAVDSLIDRLATEVRISLAVSLRELIDQAVRNELDRLRSQPPL